MTNADGGTRIETHNAHGSIASVTGTAVHGVGYTYGSTYNLETKLLSDGSASSEWDYTSANPLGQTISTTFADYNEIDSYYNSLGQLVQQIDPDGVTTLYQYNAKGEQEYTTVGINQNGTIDFSGTDRITRTVRDVVYDSSVGYNVTRTRTYVWATNSVNSSLLVSTSETSTDALRSWQTALGLTSASVTSYGTSGYRTNIVTSPDGSTATSLYQNGRVLSVTRKDSSGTQIGQTTYAYDPHGRQYQITDARNGTTTLTFNNADQVATTTTPSSGGGQSGQITVNNYDTSQRVWKTTQPDGTSVTNLFYLTGEVQQTSGSRTYPVSYIYDYAGRMTNMTTWTNFGAGTGAAATEWIFDGGRGWLNTKVYADGNGPLYYHTGAGRVNYRGWARGVTATYAYNTAGELATITYSDSTPGVTNTYDRRGRLVTVVDGAGSRTLAYNDLSQMLAESWSGGPLNGKGITITYDSYFRRNTVGMNGQSSTTTTYGYDNASRLTGVTDGGGSSATYTYLANWSLIGNTVFKQGSTVELTTAKQFDYLNRLASIANTPAGSGQSPMSFGYLYNAANQRKEVVQADSSRWNYNYDYLGQVTGGKRFWSDGTPVAGEQFGYAFDDIGNRRAASFGGDNSGANLQTASYIPNSLNEYSSRTVPAAFDVVGVATATAIVNVNGQMAERKGEFYHKTVSVSNGSAPVFQSVTETATTPGGYAATTNSGSYFVAKTPEYYTYDLDGNLTVDGHWTYTWDAENRLIAMVANTSLPNAARFSIAFAYDSQGRRVQKAVSTWNGSSYAATYTRDFLYDGWNLLSELDGLGSNALLQRYLWGMDLSGSLAGAGGVGGLVAMTDNFAAFDGNGNAVGVVAGSSGNWVAQYEYGPFGEIIRKTGPLATTNVFRFSSKYADEESDFLYYGYRYYSPSTSPKTSALRPLNACVDFAAKNVAQKPAA